MTLTQGRGCSIDLQKKFCLHNKGRTTHLITTKRSSFIPLVIVITWLDFGEVLSETLILANFFLISDVFLAATKQLYEWYFLSVCPSVCLIVCLSVCLSVTPFWLCSHHRIIMKFSGVITKDQDNVHAKGQGQRWKVKVTEVTTQLSRFRTVTPVFEFTYDDEMIHIAWCCLGEVPYCFSRSSDKFQGHTALKIVEFGPDLAFPDCNSSLNSPMAMKCCTKLEVS